MAPLALPHLYNKDTALFFNGQMIFIKRMKNLIKKILKESEDDFDWIRNTEPNAPIKFHDAIRFKTYRFKGTDFLKETVDECGRDSDIYNKAETVNVRDSDTVTYEDVVCNTESDHLVFSLKLDFYSKEGDYIDTFWVTEEMLTLYEVYDDLNESEEEFGWAQTTLINPWEVGYTGVYFDTEPTIENVAELIEMALATNPSNTNEWSLDVREEDIDEIIHNYHDGDSYLVLNKYNNLAYGPNKNYSDWGGIKYIEYSKLIDKPSINESEEEFDWIKDIPAGVELKPNTFYYFDPALTWGDEVNNFANSIMNSDWIKNWLLNISPMYRNNEGITYFVTSSTLDGMISGWCTTRTHRARILGYHGKEVVDARKQFNL